MVSQAPIARYFAVTPGFFGTMGMRLVRGRPAESERDTAGIAAGGGGEPDAGGPIFPGQDPIGKRLEIAFSDPPNWREIVGVVADVRSAGLDQDTPVQVYAAYLQSRRYSSTFHRRPSRCWRVPPRIPSLLAPAMKAAILGVDRSQPIFAIQPMTEVVAKSIAQRKLSLILLAFFAISALVLAAIGIYGVLSYTVTQQTSEIGIRMALGAQQSQVLFQIEKQGMLLVGIGLAAGLAGALIFTRFMSSLLFRVNAHDPFTLAVAAGTLVLVSLVACYLPARRAAKLDPMTALRSE